MANRLASVLVLMLTVAALQNCGEDPEEALVVSGPPDLAGAVVKIDGEVVGTLRRLQPAWIKWVAEKWFGKSRTMDSTVLVLDLRKVPTGIHTLFVERFGSDAFTRDFNYPSDLENGVISVYVTHSIMVDWPWCNVVVPPLIDCGEWGSAEDVGSTVKAETVCRLAEELKGCIHSNDWERIGGIAVCREGNTTMIMAELFDHGAPVAAILNEESGEVTCKVPH